MKSAYRWSPGFVCWLACLVPAVSADRAAPRILSVESTVRGTGVDTAPLRLPKFHDERWQEQGEEYTVRWQPRAGGSPAGTVLRFEYRQQRVREIQALEVAYPFRVTQRRAAAFSIAGRAYERGGRVTGWRVLLVEAGRVVHEKRSPTWIQVQAR